MQRKLRALGAWMAIVGGSAGCGDDTGTAASGGGGSGGAVATSGETGSSDSVVGAGGGGSDGSGGQGGAGASTGSSSSGMSSASSSGSGGGSLADPDQDGPFTVSELDGSTVSPSGNQVPIHAWYPTDAGGAPYPVVVIAHGFQLPPTQYASYGARLATHGFVALTADFPAGFAGVNNVENAQDLVAALDWVAEHATLGPIADAANSGMTGHSLGGKLALLAATMDRRVRASITLDPVDGSMGCNPVDCPDVSDLMPIDIPTGFVGEILDATGDFQACAPAADNYTTFYDGTSAPSLEVTVVGANHMSFLDDVAQCGFTCSFCNPATAANATVNALARAYVVAFYQRYLRGLSGYDDYLTGPAAQARYVDTGLATLRSR